MDVSIIIPTFNRSKYLEKCVLSIIRQNVHDVDYEVIIVDNDSTDETEKCVKKIMQTFPRHNIKYFKETVPGLLSGRHRGALESHGEIVIFVDDDIEASHEWLTSIYEGFKDSSVQLIGGRNLPMYEQDPPEWIESFWNENIYGRYLTELSLIDFGDVVKEINPNFVWGLNFSIRRTTLFELGGFNPDCIMKSLQHYQGDGETALTRKILQSGYKAKYIPSALVFHNIPKERLTLEYFKNRHYYQGVCDSFTQIRARGGLMYLNKYEKIKEILKDTLYRFFQIIKGIDASRNESDKIKKILKESWREGIKFHRDAVSKIPGLKEWVLKDDYWDYDIPS
jgi:glycosyltransferase involved in cell wall biosynthesis